MKNDQDYIYFNVQQYNNTTEDIPAKYEEFHESEFLTNPSDYKMSLIRFHIPTSTIPLLKTDPTRPYVVGIERPDGTWTTQTVNFIIDNEEKPTYIHNYTTVLQSISQAFAVITAPTPPPLLTIEDNLVRVYTPPAIYFPLNPALPFTATLNGVKLLMNDELYILLNSLPLCRYTNHPSGCDYIIRCDDTPATRTTAPPAPYASYTLKQTAQWVNVANWVDVSRLFIMSNHLPVIRQYVSFNNQTGADNKQPIICDYQLDLEKSITLDRGALYYQPTKWIYMDLYGSEALKVIDLAVYYQTKDQQIVQLTLAPREYMGFKILFEKKRKPRPIYMKDKTHEKIYP